MGWEGCPAQPNLLLPMPFLLETPREGELRERPHQRHFGDSHFFSLNFEQYKLGWEKTRWRIAGGAEKEG